jgi:hypothetical protein
MPSPECVFRKGSLTPSRATFSAGTTGYRHGEVQGASAPWSRARSRRPSARRAGDHAVVQRDVCRDRLLRCESECVIAHEAVQVFVTAVEGAESVEVRGREPSDLGARRGSAAPPRPPSAQAGALKNTVAAPQMPGAFVRYVAHDDRRTCHVKAGAPNSSISRARAASIRSCVYRSSPPNTKTSPSPARSFIAASSRLNAGDTSSPITRACLVFVAAARSRISPAHEVVRRDVQQVEHAAEIACQTHPSIERRIAGLLGFAVTTRIDGNDPAAARARASTMPLRHQFRTDEVANPCCRTMGGRPRRHPNRDGPRGRRHPPGN